jgi:hypothetical protein
VSVYGEQPLVETVVAGETLVAYQYHIVTVAGVRALNATTALGIIQGKPASADPATICLVGKSKFFAYGTIAKGADLMVGSGMVIQATSGLSMIGRSLYACTSGSVGSGVFNFVTRGYSVYSTA